MLPQVLRLKKPGTLLVSYFGDNQLGFQAPRNLEPFAPLYAARRTQKCTGATKQVGFRGGSEL